MLLVCASFSRKDRLRCLRSEAPFDVTEEFDQRPHQGDWLLDYAEGESRGEIEAIIQDPDFGVHRTTLGEVFDEYPKDYGRPCQNVIEDTKRGLGWWYLLG